MTPLSDGLTRDKKSLRIQGKKCALARAIIFSNNSTQGVSCVRCGMRSISLPPLAWNLPTTRAKYRPYVLRSYSTVQGVYLDFLDLGPSLPYSRALSISFARIVRVDVPGEFRVIGVLCVCCVLVCYVVFVPGLVCLLGPTGTY